MRPFGPAAVFLASTVATTAALRGVKRQSLSPSGAIAAWLVGFLSVGCGLRGFVLLIFYQIGTMATKYKKEIKQSRDATAVESSVRGPGQVLACSAVAVVCSLAHVYCCGEEQPIDFGASPMASSWACAIMAHHATCLADTLASEMGILSSHEPVLITSFQVVPPGTNGGVTASGTAWSGLGGGIIGVGTVAVDVLSGIRVRPLRTIAFGIVCGLVGSFVDSLLGATVQVSYYDEEKRRVVSGGEVAHPSYSRISGVDILNNTQVNLVSVLVTCALGGIVIGPAIFP